MGDSPTVTNQFELRRLSDELIYTFNKGTMPDGRDGFQREDLDLWITYRTDIGWVAWDEKSSTSFGRPWHVAPAEQNPHYPPEGEWVSKKGVKSYVYQLVYV